VSLRDQLIAKGLVSKKRADEVNRELKAERKAKQAARARKHDEEAAARAAEEAERAAREQARRAAKEATAAERDVVERANQVRQIVLGNRLGGRGRVPFAHRQLGTDRIAVLHLPESLVRDLRAGRAAVAAARHVDGSVTHHIVNERAARRLAELAPEMLVTYTPGKRGLDDPSEGLLQRAWEASLGPHRVPSGADLQRLVARIEAGRPR
jgi:uncharacterized protein YaiL (DUF2058 family)